MKQWPVRAPFGGHSIESSVRWYGCTRNVSQETCSIRCAATAVRNWNSPLKKIGQARSGVLLYLPQEGRGIGPDEQTSRL